MSVTYSLADGTNGGLASNYSLTDDTTTADITAKALTITSASAANKTYDATDTASITAGTLSGFIGSETSPRQPQANLLMSMLAQANQCL